MKILIQHMILMVFYISLTSCDGSNGGQGENASARELVEDNNLSAESVFDQMSGVLKSLAVNLDEATPALTQNRVDLDQERVCTETGTDETDGKAEVTITRDFTIERNRENKKRKTKIEVTNRAEISRIWSKTSDAIRCDSTEKYPDLVDVNKKDVQLVENFSRVMIRSLTLDLLDTPIEAYKDQSYSRSRETTATGSLSVMWLLDEKENNIISRRVSMTSDITRTSIITVGEESKELKSITKISEEAPLDVYVKKDAGTLNWISKIVASGAMTSVHENGVKYETFVAKRLKFVRNEGCMPTEGTLEGYLYINENDTEPTRSFTVDFESNPPFIMFDDGTNVDFSLEGCELELEIEDIPVQEDDPENT